MSEQTVAEMAISILDEAGVERIYGLIGDSLNPLGDAVRKNKHIEWITVRHEEAAAFAAAGESFMSGCLAVCAGTCGPGSVHLVNGLYEANRNGCPVLAIATHIPSSQIGLDYFQETNPMKLFNDCSIFCETVSHPSQMPFLMQEAIQTALSKKGVAVLILPKDISESKIDMPSFLSPASYTEPTPVPDKADVEKLAEIIGRYKKITLFCGIGCRNAKEEVLSLSETLNAPTVCTLRSKDFMESENPNNAGMTGLLSQWESKTALNECDLLLLLGTDFPFPILPKTPAIVQIDIDGKHLGRRCQLDFGINADVKSVLQALLPLLKENKDKSHLENSLACKNQVDKTKKKALKSMSTAIPLRPEYLTDLLNKTADENTVFAVDVGLCDVWAARYLKAEGTRRIIGSFKHGTMGAAVSEAMGAYYASNDAARPFVVMVGDGSFTMLMGEMLTIIQHDIPLKIIIYNNSELGFINFEAELDRIPPFKTELKNPDFAKIAEITGFKSFRITSAGEAGEILKKALSENGPVLIDAVTDPAALP